MYFPQKFSFGNDFLAGIRDSAVMVARNRMCICSSLQTRKLFLLEIFCAALRLPFRKYCSLSFVNRCRYYKGGRWSLTTLSAEYCMYRQMEPNWIISALIPWTIKERTSTPQPYLRRILFFSKIFISHFKLYSVSIASDLAAVRQFHWHMQIFRRWP